MVMNVYRKHMFRFMRTEDVFAMHPKLLLTDDDNDADE